MNGSRKYSEIHVNVRDSGSHEITLCRPDKANSISAELVEELNCALVAAEESRTRLVILRAEGKHFCSGFDFSNLQSYSDGDLAIRFLRIETFLQSLHNARFYSVVIVKGAALGAGADIVAACRQRVGTESAWFKFPGYRFGLALGTRRLSQLVGETAGRSFLLRNGAISAFEAREAGLLTSIVEEEQIEDAIEEMENTLADFDVDAIATLLKNTAPVGASADEDLGMLARSVIVPGIHARINAFRENGKKTQPLKM